MDHGAPIGHAVPPWGPAEGRGRHACTVRGHDQRPPVVADARSQQPLGEFDSKRAKARLPRVRVSQESPALVAHYPHPRGRGKREGLDLVELGHDRSVRAPTRASIHPDAQRDVRAGVPSLAGRYAVSENARLPSVTVADADWIRLLRIGRIRHPARVRASRSNREQHGGDAKDGRWDAATGPGLEKTRIAHKPRKTRRPGLRPTRFARLRFRRHAAAEGRASGSRPFRQRLRLGPESTEGR